MALQTTDVRVVLRACDARVALASVYKLPKDAQSLEVERDRQQRLDRAGRHRQLDCDSDLDSILDFDSGLNSVLDFDRDLDSARSAKESGHYARRLPLRIAKLSTGETVLWTWSLWSWFRPCWTLRPQQALRQQGMGIPHQARTTGENRHAPQGRGGIPSLTPHQGAPGLGDSVLGAHGGAP